MQSRISRELTPAFRHIPIARIEAYNSFKVEYHKVYDKFIRKSPSALEITPIKIAILDTGVDGDHPIFDAYRELKGKRNFYDASRKKTPDRHGHGTFAASLNLDYAPDAGLYVIKIADMENTSPEARVVVDVSRSLQLSILRRPSTTQLTSGK